MAKFEMTTHHEVDAVQYEAPNGADVAGNVDEVQAVHPDAVEQDGWAPATGQNALVVGDVSLANSEWLLVFDDESVLVLSDDDFQASGYVAVDGANAPAKEWPNNTPPVDTSKPADPTPAE